LIIPFFVMYLTSNVVSSRPGGYGDTSLLEKNPYYHFFISKSPYWIGFFVALPFLILGLIPLIWMYSPLYSIYGDPSFSSLGISFLGDTGIFGIIRHVNGGLSGPHGIVSLILSLFLPLGVAIMFIVAYNRRTKRLILERDKYKQLEGEFTSSLFQLGNRIGDGLPAEIAFSRVAETTTGTATEGFFSLVNRNIQQMGMGLQKALFDNRQGAVIAYPSSLVSTSMKILVESVKKGLKVAAKSLMSLSDYVKNIKKVNDRLNDLLADITSDMKSNMTFLAPLLGGIIVGLSGMITLILSALLSFIDSGIDLSNTSGMGVNITDLTSLFYVGDMIPTYWLQVIVGIYLVQVVFILTQTLVSIRSGNDVLARINETGKNLKRTLVLYFIVALISTIGLTLVAALALKGMVG
jgi:Flp pilus assembly protein TadB